MWKLELSAHLLRRMEDRGFTEIALREMMEMAQGYREDIVEGRWVIETRHNRKRWEVIVEPDHASSCWWSSQPIRFRGA